MSFRSGRRDSRDKSKETDTAKSFRSDAAPIPRNTYNRWKTYHTRTGCTRNCVTDRAHFSHWRSAYGRSLNNYHRLVQLKSGSQIPFEDFIYFAYTQSSGYVSDFM